MSKKPLRTRVMVSCSPELYELLDELATMSGASMGGLCGELLEDTKPVLQAMIKALKQARNQNADAFDTLARILAEAQMKAGEIQMDLIDTRTSLRRAPGEKGDANENGQE